MVCTSLYEHSGGSGESAPIGEGVNDISIPMKRFSRACRHLIAPTGLIPRHIASVCIL